MTRRRLDVNPEDYAVHYRTRRVSTTLIIAKALRWLVARTHRSVHRSGAVLAISPRRRRDPGPASQWIVDAVGRGHGSFQTRGFGR